MGYLGKAPPNFSYEAKFNLQRFAQKRFTLICNNKTLGFDVWNMA